MVTVLFALVLLVGCAARHLPEGITEAALKERSVEIVKLLTEREYAAVIAFYREDMRSELTIELLAELMDGILDDLGAVKRMEGRLFGDHSDPKTDEEMVFCIVTVFHDNGSRHYRVVYDVTMTLIGLYSI